MIKMVMVVVVVVVVVVIGSTADNKKRLNAKVVVPLKCLSNFSRSLHLPLIKCEIDNN